MYRNDPEPHPSKPNTFIERPSAMTMMRMGFACPPCHSRYDDLVAATNRYNEVVDQIACNNRELKLLTGTDRTTPKRRTAYIDVFDSEEAL